ncbi:hypothetical protein GCM10008931_31370 [Oceanobacillus oncorhynchi subsp. oncorhynchi]|uniref:hypothetical protein n=1 Tax=Oceanobacillus oncorhynchi TaxID=545501 RepID=UPI0031DBA9D5
MIPLISNDGEFVEILERYNLINEKLIILEKLQEEIDGIDNSMYQELSLYYYSKNERDEDKTFHFLFAIDPGEQNHVRGNPRNGIIVLDFRDIVVVF